MKILVLNAGSSSLKCQLFSQQQAIASVILERIGESESCITLTTPALTSQIHTSVPSHHKAILTLFELLQKEKLLSKIHTLDAVGHRVVHGGTLFSRPVKITPEVIGQIHSLIPLAPLHNPANLEGIESIASLYPTLTQVAVFDTAFHHGMPEAAARYPLPYVFYEENSLRRYGFHGTSHAYVAKEAAKILDKPLERLNLITLHLGNGASACAVQKGRSIDTSMGFTPLEGLMMGTRCGDIDPAIIPFLSRTADLSIETIDRILNKESGLKGICGTNDMREITAAAAEGEKKSLLAFEMFCYRIKKYIGAYSAVLGRVDAIVFTGGIGEHSAEVREKVCEGLEETFHIMMDREKNRLLKTACGTIHTHQSRTALLVIATNEELEIAQATEALIRT